MSKTKSCKTCKYEDDPDFNWRYYYFNLTEDEAASPCRTCHNFNNWKEKEEDT